MELEDKDITEKIIKCAFTVHRNLGSGFLEKLYENAMVIELKKLNLNVKQQCPISVKYHDQVIGEYFADLFVEERIICELKSAEKIVFRHEMQLVNYLSATGLDIGLLINFFDRVTVRRKFRVYRKKTN